MGLDVKDILAPEGGTQPSTQLEDTLKASEVVPDQVYVVMGVIVVMLE